MAAAHAGRHGAGRGPRWCGAVRAAFAFALVVAASTCPSCSQDGGETDATGAAAIDETDTWGELQFGSWDADGEVGAADAATSTDASEAGDAFADDGEAPSCPGGAGCSCVEQADCDIGICLDTPDGKRCADSCVTTCPKGYKCADYGGGDSVFVCVPRFLTLCAPCRDNADCSLQGVDVSCLDGGDAGHFCGASCEADETCPPGFQCSAANGVEGKQCQPVAPAEGGSGGTCASDGTCLAGESCVGGVCTKTVAVACGCSAWAISSGASTDCTSTNGAGTCSGSRSCSGDGLSPCSAATPAAEVCNLGDDDCDGVVDDLPTEATCAIEAFGDGGTATGCANDGECSSAGEACDEATATCRPWIGACAGVPTCTKTGVFQCVGAVEPQPESCNGDDDDCDGQTDEGFSWQPFDGGAALVMGASCGVGPCAGGQVQCETMLVATCTTATLAESETCNGADDDCDGQTDDGACEDGDACTSDLCDPDAAECDHPTAVDCDDANPCTSDTCQGADGSCVHSALEVVCSDDDACTVGDVCGLDAAGEAVCAAGEAAQCDDGNVCTADGCEPGSGCVQLAAEATVLCFDAAADLPGQGTCASGVRTCAGGVLGDCIGQVLPVAVEVCDGADDDCDGTTDEGCQASAVELIQGNGFGSSADDNLRLELAIGAGPVSGTAKGEDHTWVGGWLGWLQAAAP